MTMLGDIPAEELLALRAALKYSDDQPRDENGRWTSTGSSAAEERAWTSVEARIRAQGMGNCYQAAVTLMNNADALGLVNPKVIQATAVGTQEIKGRSFGHSWLEADGPLGVRLAYDYSSGHSAVLPADYYRDLGHVTDVHEYDPTEARIAMLKAGHYGPWD